MATTCPCQGPGAGVARGSWSPSCMRLETSAPAGRAVWQEQYPAGDQPLSQLLLSKACVHCRLSTLHPGKAAVPCRGVEASATTRMAGRQGAAATSACRGQARLSMGHVKSAVQWRLSVVPAPGKAVPCHFPAGEMGASAVAGLSAGGSSVPRTAGNQASLTVYHVESAQCRPCSGRHRRSSLVRALCRTPQGAHACQ